MKGTVEWRDSHSSSGLVITEAHGPLHLADIGSVMPTVGEAVGEPGHMPSMAVLFGETFQEAKLENSGNLP